MSLTPEIRTKVVNELIFCANQIIKEENLSDKLRYYSIAGDILEAINRLYYNEELQLTEMVIGVSKAVFENKIDNPSTSENPLDEKIFSMLAQALLDMADSISKKQSTENALKTIAKIFNACFNQGIYHISKGSLKFS